MNNRFALGTAQFGFSYGVANLTGQITRDEAKKIIKYAKNKGIYTLDTAIGYGNSEECLGYVGIKDWDVVTKLPLIPKNCINIFDWVFHQVESSLHRLNVKHISALMAHHSFELKESYGKELWLAMQELKDKGLINKIGYSIYEPQELDQLWEDFKPDIIQSPFNILDDRLRSSGWLSKLNKNEVEVHVRSVFLQGLLLMKKNQRPEKFDYWSNIWEEWDEWLQENNITALQGCLSFALQDNSIKKIVIGVDNLIHLEEILSMDYPRTTCFPSFESNINYDLINPSRWDYL